jgi:hypothetical protein
MHAVTHNDVANLYVARAHFSAPTRVYRMKSKLTGGT